MLVRLTYGEFQRDAARIRFMRVFPRGIIAAFVGQ
jgi:hypothetical protein